MKEFFDKFCSTDHFFDKIFILQKIKLSGIEDINSIRFPIISNVI